jgi:peptidoglycan LD-endopeptidase CwlK
MPSRKVSDLTPETQDKFKEFAVRMAEERIPFILTSTYRTQAEQDELWKRGRSLPQFKKVTWTRYSRHTDREAFDIAVVMNGRPTWDMKVSANYNDVGDYYEAGEIGESLGLVWGGRFSNPDYCHFELKKEIGNGK